MRERFDLAVVGAGIVGLAHALAAVERGLKVVVLDRDARANGASIRNFGFVTVTGQERGACWQRARRTAEVWDRIAAPAGIEILQRGLLIVARRQEAMAVLESFSATEMGEGCELLGADAARRRCPMLAPGPLAGALWSPHDLRVESRTAIPRLAAWLESRGVRVRRQVQVRAVDGGRLDTTAGPIEAGAVIVCPGDDFLSLFPDRIFVYGLTRCKLHMLRVEPGRSGWRLPGAVMADLSLVRYLGYAALPEAAALRRVVEREQPEALEHGVHLIVVQGADGSLVVGDSHHYAPTPDPFAPEAVDRIIMDELHRTLDLPAGRVVERWTGTYASAADRPMLVDSPSPDVRIVIVTSGTGASTGFALAQEVLAGLPGGSR
jgi:FAD dependent oxidoreductase TIGR03364